MRISVGLMSKGAIGGYGLWEIKLTWKTRKEMEPGELAEAATRVWKQHGTLVKETHLCRALAVELEAKGYRTATEENASTEHVDSTGMTHTIANDRVDVLARKDEKCTVIEVKRENRSNKPDYVMQAARYARNLRKRMTVDEIYVLAFPKQVGKDITFTRVAPGSTDVPATPRVQELAVEQEE